MFSLLSSDNLDFSPLALESKDDLSKIKYGEVGQVSKYISK